jgi:glucosamine kinase
MRYWMGIDGGGSNLRVAIIDDELNTKALIDKAGRVNPSGSSRSAVHSRIQRTMRDALKRAGLETVDGVGIGVAGAAAAYAEDWLRQVVGEVLPDAFVAPSSDNEIALVGAHGARRGVLLLSGTGSVAFGVNAAGEAWQVGGWGYLLGDEGSGYWIGMEALRTVIRQHDGTHPYGSSVTRRIMDVLNLTRAHEIIPWLYGADASRISDVAGLARIVLEEAERGDMRAAQIVEAGAWSLRLLATTIIERLQITQPNIAFAGGLLTSDNALSRRVCALLELPAIPQAKYPPVIGAALLAKLRQETNE